MPMLNGLSALVGNEDYTISEYLDAMRDLKIMAANETFTNKATGQEEHLFDPSYIERYMGYDPGESALKHTR